MSNTTQIASRKTPTWIRIASLGVILVITVGIVAFIAVSIGSSSLPPANNQLNSAPVVPQGTPTFEGKPTSNLPTYTPLSLETFPTLPGYGRTATPRTGDIIITLETFPTLPGYGRTATPRTGDIIITIPPIPTLPYRGLTPTP